MAEHFHPHLDPETLRAKAGELRAHYAGMASWGIRENKVASWMRDVPKAGRVLDIGSGSGALSEMLLSLGFRNLQPCDIHDYRSSPAAQALPFTQWDANHDRLPFADGSVDGVIALQMLEHVENPWHAVREFARVLKVGGRCVISIPHGFSLPSRLRFLRSGNVIGFNLRNNHISFQTADVFQKMVGPYFTLERTDYSNPFIRFAGRKLRLPPVAWVQRRLSEKVCYVLRRHDRPVDVGTWKGYASYDPAATHP
ncbi:class I SAM-dependent methyltransferase [Patescibacteria group bacterium]|nr:MAG: class I SAM-dependent methyltransferase [Patescibacteria group bacterium]